MTNYPTSADDSTSLPDPTAVSKTNSPSHSSLHANANGAIKALEAKLGTGASTPVANRLLFGNGTGTSAWSQLSSTQLAASLSDETGSGSAVFATSPTLVTPLVNTINEATAANGVTIDGLNIKDGALNTNNSVVTANITDAAATAPKMNNSGTWNSSWSWQSYTPTWTNVTTGNGTVSFKYTQIGKTVNVRFLFTLGSTSAVSGQIIFTTPTTIASGSVQFTPLGVANCTDQGVADYFALVGWQSSTQVNILPYNSAGTYASAAFASSTVPFTWGSADKIHGSFTYEAA